MIINKILNNNAVTTIIDNQEAVVMGNGIGFHKKVNDEICEDNISKIFKMDNEHKNEKFKQLILATPPEYLTITREIVYLAETTLKHDLSEFIYFLLTDHLVFAVMREKENMQIENPMSWEIQNIYKMEYSIGLKALDIVENYTGVRLSDDEASFIALHIVNASLNEEISNTLNITVLTNKILSIIRRYFLIKFDEDSLDYNRLVTHLNFFAQRIFRHEQVKYIDEDLYELLTTKYVEATKCIADIEIYLKQQFNYDLSKQEIIYLIMHINRVISK